MVVLPWIIVLLSLIYLVLLFQQIHWCWLFGILASALSYFVFQPKLFFESFLYLYYVGIGIYAWWMWQKKGIKKNSKIKKLSFQKHLVLLVLQFILVGFLGYYFAINKERLHPFVSERPFADAFTTVFSLVATFLEAQRFLYSWLYWIVINFFSVWLYAQVQEPVLAGQMGLYGILSIWGFARWKKLSQ